MHGYEKEKSMAENTEQAEEKITQADYPGLTQPEINELNKGKLPGSVKLATTTLIIALMSLVVSMCALVAAVQ